MTVIHIHVVVVTLKITACLVFTYELVISVFFSHSQISQQLDVIGRLERDLSESSRELEHLKEKTAEDVSAEGEEPFLNNNTYFQD